MLLDYTGAFKMVGKLSIGDQIRETHFRHRNITEYEAYINAIDQDYESKYAIFKGYFFKVISPQFNLVSRKQYVNGFDFKHEINKYRVNNCFIATKRLCFVKCVNHVTGGDYNEQYFDFIRLKKDDEIS